jgi:hypothetical protein
MTGLLAGPSLVVHILVIAMADALIFPFLFAWFGSILCAFFISVMILCAYGLVAIWIFGKKKE